MVNGHSALSLHYDAYLLRETTLPHPSTRSWVSTFAVTDVDTALLALDNPRWRSTNTGDCHYATEGIPIVDGCFV